MDERRCMCGRCGYDLSGIVESWSDRCPLTGQCSECGCEFRWRDIFHIDRLNQRWLVEHASGRWSLIARIPRTVGYSVLPWLFWRRLPVQASVSLRRAALASVLLLGLLHVGIGGYNSWVEVDGMYSNYTRAWRSVAPLGLSSGPQLVCRAVFGDLVELGLNPSAIPGSPLAGTLSRRGQFSQLQLGTHSQVTMSYGSWEALGITVAVAVPNLIWLGMLSLLPTTRQLAKLRAVHLWRAVIYGIAGVWICMEAIWLFAEMPWIFTEWVIVAMAFGVIVWNYAWWWSVIVFGWRLKHRWAVAVLLSVVVFLASLFMMLILAVALESA